MDKLEIEKEYSYEFKLLAVTAFGKSESSIKYTAPEEYEMFEYWININPQPGPNYIPKFIDDINKREMLVWILKK
ncbi:Hypothetical protein PACV_348 [Pacmanvirus A23]|uniref:Hypothetical protein n=1 Tax=Pacmanvirus A23 TaxID=1932881 RepID=UPI000A094A05|nr:Hypothetical protein B9W72_gp344 [Pacmanvirus A23]SIP86061.1 Hypothetical protein PACV_348 [Pacmanvirus A23]